MKRVELNNHWNKVQEPIETDFYAEKSYWFYNVKVVSHKNMSILWLKVILSYLPNID
jgi:hypothetical protein